MLWLRAPSIDSLAILYLPSSRDITVDLGQFAGPEVAAHWYDPADGHFSTSADRRSRHRDPTVQAGARLQQLRV